MGAVEEQLNGEPRRGQLAAAAGVAEAGALEGADEEDEESEPEPLSFLVEAAGTVLVLLASRESVR